MENSKNKKSVKFQGDMLNLCDFIQVFVFTTNHHLKCAIVSLQVFQYRNLDFGYLEQPLISKTKSGPCLNLTSGNNLLWIRGEIAPQEQFLPFSTIFSIYISN